MLYETLNKFRNDERGSVIAFVVVMFLFMFLAAGMAVDFIRHETARADLQNALDRGVLAAADLEQRWVTASPDEQAELEKQYTELVESYMQTRSFGADPNVKVTPTLGLASKRIEATANYDLKTYFLPLMGITSMNVPARSVAVEAKRKLEISLVLDVSGSMYNNQVTFVNNVGDTVTGRRIDLLKQEAQNFIGYLMEADPTGENRAINLVPYSHRVSMSENMAKQYPNFYSNREHDYSYCMEFEPTDYPTIAISPTGNWRQSQQFFIGNAPSEVEGESKVVISSCSRSENNMKLFSNNVTDIQSHIQGMGQEIWTSVYEGMRWGTALLDPDTRSVVNGLIDVGDVEAQFADLPRDYGTEGNIKIVILMSDGANTLMPQMRTSSYEQGVGGVGGANYWRENRPAIPLRTTSNGGSAWAVSRYPTEESLPSGADLYGKNTNRENNTIGDFLAYDNDGKPGPTGTGGRVRFGDARLYEVCEEAKADKNDIAGSGIVVYSIGFLANDAANTALELCASPNNFYEANEENLGRVFETIAKDIDKLKLVN